MNTFFQNVLTASFHGSIVILAVLALRLVLRKAPKKFICWLWMLAGLRLLMPIPIQSPFSLQPQSVAIPISVNLSAFLPLLWVAVAVIIGVYSVASYIHLRSKVLDAVKVPGGWESDRIETAFVLGFFNPKIYIPTGMPREAKKQILAHERTHLDKGDHWIKMIGFLALALHWFNPLVWVSYILLCKDIEMACDERVVQFMELEERKAYSSALLRCSTNHPHYAACPVAFGEVSVKYRIKSVLNYRKPSFWLSLLCIVAICFVAVCLMTSPEKTVEVPVDPDVPLQEISRQDPADFTPAVMPALEANPDWGVNVIMDVTAPTGGKLVYIIEERFADASENITMKNGSIDRWDGAQWVPLVSQSGKSYLFENDGMIGFAQHRDRAVTYYPQDLDWTLSYGALPAGDYRLTQTIESDTDSATFQTGFHIYREELPREAEAAMDRCTKALDTLVSSPGYSVILSETDLNGGISPVMQIRKGSGEYRLDYFLGEFCTSSAASDQMPYSCDGWDAPFRLNQNRQFLFPEGQSHISQQEITFRSAWADFKGDIYRGTDTYRFQEDGSLSSVDRLVQTLDGQGGVASEHCIRLEAAIQNRYLSVDEDVMSYDYEDAFDASTNSPWNIFFRVDDDYLNPSGGEIWLGAEVTGVSKYTTDGSYWLEKKSSDWRTPQKWERLGGEDTEASWGDETVKLVSRTTFRNIDWTDTYGELGPGVYRMGKRFYDGSESIIQYAEFAIYQTGGIFGEGSEEALARADAAMAKLQSGNYRVEQYSSGYAPYLPEEVLTEVVWKYGDNLAYDFHNKAGGYSHTYVETPDTDFHMDWWKRSADDSPYSSIYFSQGQSIISDREIRFVQTFGRESLDNFSTVYTYRFDENGNLTEFLKEYKEYSEGINRGSYLRYVITETPESEIQSWVETKLAEQN